MTFNKGFGDYVCDGDSIACEVDGVTYTARLVHDADSSPHDADCYSAANITAWEHDEWTYYGVVIDAERNGWIKRGLASLWGIEGNLSEDNSYLLKVANELLPEAIAQVQS